MIKKIVLLVLLVVFCALSVALYNQYRLLPRSVTDARDLAFFADRPERADTAGQAMTDRAPLPSPDEAAPRLQPRIPPSQSPDQEARPPREAQPLVSGEKDVEDPMLDPSSLGHPELSPEHLFESRPAPEKTTHPIEDRPGLESKTEKALEKAEHWVEEKVERVEEIAGEVKQELETEKKVIEEMELSREDATMPETRVDKLVRQIEERALGEIQPEPAIREPIVKPPHVYELEPEPKDDPKQPTQRNRVVSIELVLAANETILDIRTEAPVEQHRYFQIKGPRRLVVDLYGSFRGSRPRLQVPDNPLISDVRTGLHPDKLRIVADLHPDAAVTVTVESRSPTRLVVVMQPEN
jgi:hypothetical protein